MAACSFRAHHGVFCVLVTQAPPMSVVVDEVLSKVPSVDAAGDLGGHYDG